MKRILALIMTITLIFTVTVFSHAEIKIFGDVDHNGTVNSSDALMILQYSTGQSGIELDISDADINRDGHINSADALGILQVSVGQDDMYASYVMKIIMADMNQSTTSKTTTTKKTTTTTTTKKTTTTQKPTTTTTTKKTTTTQKPTTTTTTKKTTTTQKPTTTTTTKKTTTTTKKTTTTTKKAATTTKKTTTAAPKTYSCPYEVTPGTTVKLPSGLNARHKRAWLVTKFSGLDIRISRLEYGANITQRFDSKINKQIVNPKTITYAPACIIAVINCDKPTRLNISKGTSQTSTEADAKSVDAAIAIPGTKLSYWQDVCATIRSGTLYKKFTGTKTTAPQLVMYKSGKWEIRSLDNNAAQEAIKNGAYNSFNIQDIIIKNGKFSSNWKDTTYRNHTFLGQISETKYVFMSSEFMPIKSAGEIMLKYGVKTAVMICGGNCTTMYLKGVGNSTNSTGASVKGMNKLGYYETEWFAKYGMLEAKKGGGPCTDEMDCIYFK